MARGIGDVFDLYVERAKPSRTAIASRRIFVPLLPHDVIHARTLGVLAQAVRTLGVTCDTRGLDPGARALLADGAPAESPAPEVCFELFVRGGVPRAGTVLLLGSPGWEARAALAGLDRSGPGRTLMIHGLPADPDDDASCWSCAALGPDTHCLGSLPDRGSLRSALAGRPASPAIATAARRLVDWAGRGPA